MLPESPGEPPKRSPAPPDDSAAYRSACWSAIRLQSHQTRVGRARTRKVQGMMNDGKARDLSGFDEWELELLLEQRSVRPGGRATARKRSRLLDDLVDLREQRWRDRQPQRVRGFQIDHRLERGWLLDGQIRGLSPLDDLVDVVRRPLVQERVVGGQRHEGACDNGLAITGHVRESALRREVEEHLPVRIEVSHDDYRLRALFRHGRERALEVVDAADDGRDESNARSRCRRPQILHERTAVRIGRRGRRENGHAVEVRDQLLEKLKTLAADLRIDARQARHVPAGMSEACDEAQLQRSAGVKWATMISTPVRTSSA